MPVIVIDGKPYQVAAGQNVLQAALALGFRLPYFCWHPALGSAGACRQCAVKLFKDEHDTRGRIVMACMTPAADGTRIAIEDPEAIAFRAAVLEWLMTNHPHDCPVCDEGGECHLQDMTVMTGHAYRRFRFRKRTYRNQDLGPLVHHEMNRCIQCFRCVRFYRDYAGGTDLVPLGSRNQTYFGRAHDGALESPFSGNLVEVCPTGVFTDKRLRAHYTRKWDLQSAPSICVHCGVGCNTLAGERYGELRRILNRYHGEVNGYFLCDRGRYGHEFVNGPERVRQARARGGETAPAQLKEVLGSGARLIGIGSPRASLESNYALRTLVGRENFFNGLDARESSLVATVLDILQNSPVRTPSLRAIEDADAVLLLGEDVTNVAPRLALAIRQAVRERAAQAAAATRLKTPAWDAGCVHIVAGDAGRPLYVLTPAATALDDIATGIERATPERIARIGFAVARILDPQAPGPADLDPEGQALAKLIGQVLRTARRPLVVAGTSSGSVALLQAAANVAAALHRQRAEVTLSLIVPECNTLGVALLAEGGLDGALAAAERVEAGPPALIVLENDLFRRMSAASAQRLLGHAAHVIAIDAIETATTRAADIVLPAATFAECAGTFVNLEGRAQTAQAVFPCPDGVRPGWRWLAGAMTLAELRAALAREFPTWGARAMPAEVTGVNGVIAQGIPARAVEGLGMRIPRQSHRATGRTAVSAHIEVSEPKPPPDTDSPFAFSMEGFPLRPPAAWITRYWAPGWNSVQALTRFQEEIAGPLRGGDPGVRLFEPRADAQPDYFTGIPGESGHRASEWRVIELTHVFGTDELSALAPGVSALAPAPYVALNVKDAERVGVKAGERVRVAPVVDEGMATGALLLPIVIRRELPAGVAGLPLGLHALAGLGRPEWISLQRAEGGAS